VDHAQRAFQQGKSATRIFCCDLRCRKRADTNV
jgi:hypothetical protein